MILALLLSFTFGYGQAKECAVYSELNSAMQCAPDNYLINFGEKYCLKYLSFQNMDFFSSETDLVLNYIRPCLQEKLRSATNLTFENSEELAMGHHVTCYVESGFCDLSFLDKFSIAAVAWKDSSRKTSKLAMAEIALICRKL